MSRITTTTGLNYLVKSVNIFILPIQLHLHLPDACALHTTFDRDQIHKDLWLLFGKCFSSSIFHWKELRLQLYVCIGKSTMKQQQKLDWGLDLSLRNYGYWKCTFVDFITKNTGHSNYMEWLIKFEDKVQSL
jgi:hypothetical protein